MGGVDLVDMLIGLHRIDNVVHQSILAYDW